MHNIVFLPIKNHQNYADCQYIKIDYKAIFSTQENIHLAVKQQHTNIKRIFSSTSGVIGDPDPNLPPSKTSQSLYKVFHCYIILI